jgi:dipeptidyl-peptidase 4
MNRPLRSVPLLLALALPAGAAATRPLSIDSILSPKGLVGRTIENTKWSPDGRRFGWIEREEAASAGDLRVIDVATGERSVLVPAAQLASLAPSVETAKLTEQEKERRRRYSVSAWEWAPDGKALLFTGDGDLFRYDLATRQPTRLTSGGDASDPKFSPDGRWVAFLRNHDLWLVPSTGGGPQRLTLGGSDTLLHGELDWLYPEELDARAGWSWAPDSRRIAFLELDQSAVATYPLVDGLQLPPRVTMQRYPYAGTPNPKARLGIVTLSGQVRWLESPAWAEYLPRFDWADPKTLAVQYLDRRQQRLDLILRDADGGRDVTVVSEKDAAYVNTTDDLRFLPSGDLLWSSERSGLRKLYVYSREGRLRRQVTDWALTVTAVLGLVDDGKSVLFQGAGEKPAEKHLYRVPLTGGKPIALTAARGNHVGNLAPGGGALLHAVSSAVSPPTIDLLVFGKRGETKSWPVDVATLDPSVAIPRIEFSDLPLPDGAVGAALTIYPAGFDPAKRYPVLVYVYGGPQAPVVGDFWMGRERGLWHWMMAERGYLVVLFDDRTSSRIGHRHEVPVKGRLGLVGLEDHRALVSHLRALPYVAGDRIGIWGWSGGGYSTVYDLTHAPDLFRAGASVAGLYLLESYDTVWSERIMGLPQENAAAYRESSALSKLENLRVPLLVAHGGGDDNVHVQNAEMLIDRLVSLGKPHDVVLFPGRTHSLNREMRAYLYGAMTRFFDRELRGECR